jgi:glucose-6-phosphate isomerase
MNFFEESIAIALMRKKKIPNIQITHADLMEEGLAELIVFFEYMTVYLSYLLDFDFDDISAVQIADSFMNALLGKPGFKSEKSQFSRLITVFEKFKIRK